MIAAARPPRERLWIAVALGCIALACWAWLVPAALDMHGGMRGIAAWMMHPRRDFSYAALMFGMWAAMMTGMMLPSALPTALLFARVVQSDNRVRSPWLRVALFTTGYLAVWLAFCLLAVAVQQILYASALLTPMLRLRNATVGGILLILAGAYQWLPAKRQCLAHCRSPAVFIASHWHPGARGALRLGLRHGVFCLGCCWMLMLLLFVGGVMNLAWIIAITLMVLLEKFASFGAQAGRLVGALLAVAGAAVIGFGLG
ncbi:MAG TPA: DUF2182 domain-containing protein [Rhodanobacteraceae bacterium]|nr:DUF2182 domain-containing protein [Rhodanobacteraceae bacterium]